MFTPKIVDKCDIIAPKDDCVIWKEDTRLISCASPTFRSPTAYLKLCPPDKRGEQFVFYLTTPQEGLWVKVTFDDPDYINYFQTDLVMFKSIRDSALQEWAVLQDEHIKFCKDYWAEIPYAFENFPLFIEVVEKRFHDREGYLRDLKVSKYREYSFLLLCWVCDYESLGTRPKVVWNGNSFLFTFKSILGAKD